MVLVTGATGLVGSHAVLHLLENGESVRALYRLESRILSTRSLFAHYGKQHLFEKIEWMQCDITDIPSLDPAFDKVRSVWHCAALISFDQKDEEAMRKVNIEGTANIVNLSLFHNVEKLCFVSSIAALGDLKEHESVIDEETEWNPEKHHSDYAISKFGAEMEIWRGQQEGLKAIIVNPAVILGPGFWDQGSGKIFSSIAGEMPFYTDGRTGFIAVTDVVEIMYLLCKSDITGERFALVSENKKLRDIANVISDALQVRRPSIKAKYWMTEMGWILDYIMSSIIRTKRKLFRDTARALHADEKYSSTKVQKVLNYEFTAIDTYATEVAAAYKKGNLADSRE